MLRRLIALLFLGLLASLAASRQSPDPLPGLPRSGERAELLLLWEKGADQSSMQSHQKIYSYRDSASLPISQKLFGAAEEVDTGVGRGVAGNHQMIVADGHFNADRYEDAVAAWTGPNGNVNLLLPQIRPSTLSWSSSVHFTSNGSVLPGGGAGSRRIYLATGNFDDDKEDEFVLAFHGADSTLHLEVYDVDSTFTPSLRASILDEPLSPTPDPFARYSLARGDFDGDGKDEIALAFYDPNGGGTGVWGIVVKVYAIGGAANDELVPKARETVFTNPGGLVTGLNLALVSGKFTSDSASTLALAVTLNTGAGVNDTYLTAMRVSRDLGTITANQPGRASGDFNNENEIGALSVAAGDLNLDGRDDIVLGLHGVLHLFDVDDSLSVTPRGQASAPSAGPDDDRLSYEYVAVGDFDHDFRPDIIVVNDLYGNDPNPQSFSAYLYSADSTLQQLTRKASLQGELPAPDNGAGSWRHYALATGDFGGGRLRVGVPYHYFQQNVVEPIVILNAPPVQFDVFDTTKYDVNGCYNGGACDFTAKYEKSTSTSVEVEVKSHDDWSVVLGAGASGSLGAGSTVNYSGFIQNKWGDEFNKDTTRSHTLSIGVAVEAAEDDQIYATVSDYDVWEYPVYFGTTDTIGGAIVVKSPRHVESRWFPSKSWSASSYVPDHEVGQVLSYRAYDTLKQNPNVDQQIRASYTSDSYELSSNTSFDWDLMLTDFITSSADTAHNDNSEINFNFVLIFDYTSNSTTLTTHTTSVTTQLNLHTHLGGINLSYGETRYTVTPYAYWAKNGSLTVDYAVRPELANPGFPPTWWQQKYGNSSNPTFILPWRLDPEKGFGLSEQAKRYQTKDISFDPENPQPGDTVTITARIRNFSLIPTPGPVAVRFYVGDPDSGGQLISGVHGETSVSTSAPLGDRGRSDVQMRWVLPGGLQQYPRIYAVLDPGGVIPEIHENDNKGFNVLGQQPVVTGVVEGSAPLPAGFKLEQNYPNPFNPTTTIAFDLPVNSIVTVRVFDVLGREVATVADNAPMPAGKQRVSFDAGPLASGVYFYRLLAQGEPAGARGINRSYSDVRKMIVLK